MLCHYESKNEKSGFVAWINFIWQILFFSECSSKLVVF